MTARPGPGRGPGHGLGRRRPGDDVAGHQPGLPDDRAAAARGPRGARRRASRRRSDRPGPRQSEPDLFLRLCVAPTIGVTGTKGKTTTASLTAAILAADPGHPVVLGGNIGIPIVERLAELTPDHRVVYELSELQLPTLSRGTTVAVYTNVTSDHLDRHGSIEAYRRVKRRLSRAGRPRWRARAQRRGPGRRRLRRPGQRPVRARPPRPTDAGRARRRRRLDRRGRRGATAAGRRGHRGHGTGWPDHADRRAGHPRCPQRRQRAGRGRRGGPPVRHRPGRDPGRGRGVHRGRAPPRDRRAHRRRALRQRLAGDAARRGHRRAPRVRRARSSSSPAAATRTSTCRPCRRSSPNGPSPRSSSARAARTSAAASRAAGLPIVEEAGDLDAAVRRRRRAGPRRAGRMPVQAPGRRPCCSARRPPASTCSWTTPPADGRSRPPWRHSPPSDGRALDPGEGPMNLAPPIPRFGRPGTGRSGGDRARAGRSTRRSANRTPAKSPTQVLQRERHQPDYLIVVVVVALAAIGILMVFSSSAMRGYIVRGGSVRHRRPADPVGASSASSRCWR